MTALTLHKIMKLRALSIQYWILTSIACENQNVNQVCSHLENINKLESQIQNLELNQSINFIFHN